MRRGRGRVTFVIPAVQNRAGLTVIGILLEEPIFTQFNSHYIARAFNAENQRFCLISLLS